MFCEWFILGMPPSLKIQMSVYGMVAGTWVSSGFAVNVAGINLDIPLSSSFDCVVCILSFCVWATGGFIAALYDLDFNLYGYIIVAINSFFTAAYLICIAKFGKQVRW